jgi:Ca2+-binding EF-hand superfamily protein
MSSTSSAAATTADANVNSNTLRRATTFSLAPTFTELASDGSVQSRRALQDADFVWPEDEDDTESDDDENTLDYSRRQLSISQHTNVSRANVVAAAQRVRSALATRFLPVSKFKYESMRPSHQWKDGRPLPVADLLALCDAVTAVLAAEPSLLELQSPCFVLGDLHGNYKDLSFFERSLWNLGPDLTPASFLFLGDFVDRGPHSIETAAYVLCMKAIAPRSVSLLQGNHESSLTNGDVEHYGVGSFKSQCHALYGPVDGERVWLAFNCAFSQMPIAATIDRRIFCVHGGVPRAVVDAPPGSLLPRIRALQRPLEPSEFVVDLLWSDPAEADAELGQDGFPRGFGPSSRGEDVAVFSEEAVAEFFAKTGCSHLVRAHQPPSLGVQFTRSARVVTIFSSSHYCGGFNSAAVLLVARNRLQIIVSTIDNSNEDGAGTVVASSPSKKRSAGDDGDDDRSSDDDSSEEPQVVARRTQEVFPLSNYNSARDRMFDATFASRDRAMRVARSAAKLPTSGDDMTVETASRFLDSWSSRLRPVRAMIVDALDAGLQQQQPQQEQSPPPPLARDGTFSALVPNKSATLNRSGSNVLSRDVIQRFVDDAEGYVRQNDWQLRRAFVAAAGSTGTASRRALADALRAVGRETHCEERVEAVMAFFDANGDQRMTFDAFRVEIGQIESGIDARRFAPSFFQHLDRSQRGALDMDDIEQLLSDAALPQLRRCLPVSSVLAARDSLVRALQQLPMPVTQQAFVDEVARQVVMGQVRESAVAAEFHVLADKNGMIDYDQFLSLLQFVEQDDENRRQTAQRGGKRARPHDDQHDE